MDIRIVVQVDLSLGITIPQQTEHMCQAPALQGAY